MEEIQITSDCSTTKQYLELFNRSKIYKCQYIVFSFARTNAGDSRDYFSHYNTPNTEIKDFSILIDRKSFLDLPVKNEEAHEKIVEMSNNNDHTTGNRLDFAYLKENYRLIAIDLSKQTNLKNPQQIIL